MRIYPAIKATFRQAAILLSAPLFATSCVMQAPRTSRLCMAGYLGVAVSLLSICPAEAAPMEFAGAAVVDPMAGFIAEASYRFGIPVPWICAVMRVESAGNAHVVSAKGAMGLMQIMPQTWASLQFRYHLGADPFDPRDNILAGAAYLRELYDRFGIGGFLAAYNAGPERYEAFAVRGQPLPDETRGYVAMIAEQAGGSGIGIGDSLTATTGFPNARSLFTSSSDEHLLAIQTSADLSPKVPTDRRDSPAESLLSSQSAGLFAQASGRDLRP